MSSSAKKGGDDAAVPAMTPALASISESNNMCAWSVFKDCNPLLPPPISCNQDGCTSLVHAICQSCWENKNNHNKKDDTWAMYCPAHHPSAASNITTRTAGEELPLVAAALRTCSNLRKHDPATFSAD
jgi:hypothetical protein